jgi:hypothetical protein
MVSAAAAALSRSIFFIEFLLPAISGLLMKLNAFSSPVPRLSQSALACFQRITCACLSQAQKSRTETNFPDLLHCEVIFALQNQILRLFLGGNL